MSLTEQYRKEAIPIIQTAIIECRNEPDDLKQQQHISAKFPWHKTNLIAHRVWAKEVERLRHHFYKHKSFKDV